MTQLFTGNAVCQLVVQSDWISKGVLLILLAMSIMCWTIFLYKWLLLRSKKKTLKRIIDELRYARSLEELAAIASRNATTAGGYFIAQSLSQLKAQLEYNQVRNGGSKLSREDHVALQEHGFQLIDELTAQDELHVPFLSASAAVSPLLGLFGTIWGLVHAFVRISEKQSADIATVAPGIAEALITTLAGLIVAIPALVMFVYLSAYVRTIEQMYGTLAERYSQAISKLV